MRFLWFVLALIAAGICGCTPELRQVESSVDRKEISDASTDAIPGLPEEALEAANTAVESAVKAKAESRQSLVEWIWAYETRQMNYSEKEQFFEAQLHQFMNWPDVKRNRFMRDLVEIDRLAFQVTISDLSVDPAELMNEAEACCIRRYFRESLKNPLPPLDGEFCHKMVAHARRNLERRHQKENEAGYSIASIGLTESNFLSFSFADIVRTCDPKHLVSIMANEFIKEAVAQKNTQPPQETLMILCAHFSEFHSELLPLIAAVRSKVDEWAEQEQTNRRNAAKLRSRVTTEAWRARSAIQERLNAIPPKMEDVLGSSRFFRGALNKPEAEPTLTERLQRERRPRPDAKVEDPETERKKREEKIIKKLKRGRRRGK
jgi:hypothetical protein